LNSSHGRANNSPTMGNRTDLIFLSILCYYHTYYYVFNEYHPFAFPNKFCVNFLSSSWYILHPSLQYLITQPSIVWKLRILNTSTWNSPLSCHFVNLPFPDIQCNIRKFHHHIHEFQPMINMTCQINPIHHSHPTTNIFLYLISSIARLFTPFLPTVPEFKLSDTSFVSISHFSHVFLVPHNFLSPSFDYVSNVLWVVLHIITYAIFSVLVLLTLAS
jgi:hypothetical protein